VEEDLLKLIEADPENPMYLGNFAVFLSDVRKDHERAQEMYERAIKADPEHAIHLGNFAQLLFCIGDKEKAQQILARAHSEDTGERADVTLELAFCQYAHGPASDRADALTQIRSLLENDVRSPEWNLSGNVQRAVEDGFRPKTWLKKLAAVISDGEPLDSLEKWAAWQKAASADHDDESSRSQ
jgi:Tfp pilus assembly protein PilF